MAHAELNDGTLFWITGVGSWYRFAESSPGLDRTVRMMNDALHEEQAKLAL